MKMENLLPCFKKKVCPEKKLVHQLQYVGPVFFYLSLYLSDQSDNFLQFGRRHPTYARPSGYALVLNDESRKKMEGGLKVYAEKTECSFEEKNDYLLITLRK